MTQLYDPDIMIQEVAVRYLEDACESPDILEMVVEMHPTIDHLGEVGHGLLLKCVRSRQFNLGAINVCLFSVGL